MLQWGIYLGGATNRVCSSVDSNLIVRNKQITVSSTRLGVARQRPFGRAVAEDVDPSSACCPCFRYSPTQGSSLRLLDDYVQLVANEALAFRTDCQILLNIMVLPARMGGPP